MGCLLLAACGGRAIGLEEGGAGGTSGGPGVAGGVSSVGGASAGTPTISGGRNGTMPVQGGTMASHGGTSVGVGGTGVIQGGAAAGGWSAAGTAGRGEECTDFAPCGGRLEGFWSVDSSCLEVTDVADIELLGLGCKEVPVRGSLFVAGSFSVDANGAVEDRTLTAGTVRFSLPPQCLNVSGTLVECPRVAVVFSALGYEGAVCDLVGSVCECYASVNQVGSMGLVTAVPSTQGQAKVDQQSFFVSTFEGTESYAYCARGKVMQVTPRGGGLRGTVSGTISLDRR